MSSTIKSLRYTNFKCLMCDEIIVFDIDDPNTYISKSLADDFFSMKLSRYVVKHDTQSNEEHFNVVIVDQNHTYRGHKDFYRVSKTETNEFNDNYQINIFPPTNHSKIELLFIVDFQKHEISEFINSSKIRVLNLVLKIDEFIKQHLEIYDNLPEELIYVLLNKKFYSLKKADNVFIVLSLYDMDSYYEIKELISLFNTINISGNSLNISIFTLILRIIDLSKIKTDADKISEFIAWITKNTILYVPLVIDTEGISCIHDFLVRLPDKFMCKFSPGIMDVFNGKITVLQYIQDHPSNYDCTKTIIDMIERRTLLRRA